MDGSESRAGRFPGMRGLDQDGWRVSRRMQTCIILATYARLRVRRCAGLGEWKGQTVKVHRAPSCTAANSEPECACARARERRRRRATYLYSTLDPGGRYTEQVNKGNRCGLVVITRPCQAAGYYHNPTTWLAVAANPAPPMISPHSGATSVHHACEVRTGGQAGE